jgi:hypothetical protein
MKFIIEEIRTKVQCNKLKFSNLFDSQATDHFIILLNTKL